MDAIIKQFNNEELMNIFSIASLALTDSICKQRIEDMIEDEPHELNALQKKLLEVFDKPNDMRKKFKVFFPVTHNLGPCNYNVSDKPMETKEEEALWHYNKSREHDGLPPLSKLPRGVKFVEIFA
jgi:hypothetical protein